MDIDEWEFLPDDGYLDFNEDSEKQIFIGKGNLVSKSVLDVNHFCPTPPRKPSVLNQLVPLQIPLEPKIGNTPDDGLVQDITKIVAPSEKIKDLKFEPSVEADQETVSQVFFKIKENEFVDMKVDSPRSSSRGLLKFEDKGEAMEVITSPRMKKIEKDMIGMECEKEEEGCSTWEEENNNNGFNIWKWSLTGVGAICSFGVAAAIISVLFFGTKQRNKIQDDQKIRFQIYTDDKRIKQVHATKLNEAISVVRGVPLSTARITIGGYYDGL